MSFPFMEIQTSEGIEIVNLNRIVLIREANDEHRERFDVKAKSVLAVDDRLYIFSTESFADITERLHADVGLVRLKKNLPS